MSGRKGEVRRIGRGQPVGSAATPAPTAEGIPDAYPRSQDHHERFHRLINLELEEEMAAVEERLRKWPRARLVENGLTLFDLEGRNDGWLFGDRVVKVFGKGQA
ncbi:MAG TPA: hypothetical protein EYQ80_03595, partial [Candidatus Poseidoniales archaeon]|nr:hypothetical protein [Candidatus Poseidoniales archaeon]